MHNGEYLNFSHTVYTQLLRKNRQKIPLKALIYWELVKVAERGGFEPPIPLRLVNMLFCWLSDT